MSEGAQGGAGQEEPATPLEAYDEAQALKPFGFENPGSLCYFNSLLQALLGCTAFIGAAASLEGTKTGRALAELVREAKGAPEGGRLSAAKLFEALLEDLREKKPGALGHFGRGQQSATEAFIFMLEMAESGPGGGSPLTRLFSHRYRCEVTCLGCRTKASQEDSAVTMYLGQLGAGTPPPRDEKGFAAALLRQAGLVEGYACGGCGRAEKAIRQYFLTLVPEVLVCHFDRYTARAKPRPFFPRELSFPAKGGGVLAYRLVGQVEHAGGLEGGHYTAKGLRAGGLEYGFNDGTASRGALGPEPGTYLAVYHAAGRPSPGS